MLGVSVMNTKEANIALLSKLPEEAQQQIYAYITKNFITDSPFAPKKSAEIYEELAESRASYERGMYEDFDDALSELSTKYGI